MQMTVTTFPKVFSSQIPHLDKAEFNVEVQSLGENSQPVVITQSEYMRRMKQIESIQPGMSFYQQMPDSYTLVLNSDHTLVKKVLESCNNKTSEALKPILSELKGLQVTSVPSLISDAFRKVMCNNLLVHLDTRFCTIACVRRIILDLDR